MFSNQNAFSFYASNSNVHADFFEVNLANVPLSVNAADLIESAEVTALLAGESVEGWSAALAGPGEEVYTRALDNAVSTVRIDRIHSCVFVNVAGSCQQQQAVRTFSPDSFALA